MRRSVRAAASFALLGFVLAAPALTLGAADPPLAGYATKLFIDGPIAAGESQTISGGGAPVGPGIWVELWKIPARGVIPESVASAQAFGGQFVFERVSVGLRDRFFVTLSRSWQFKVDGDLEGWNATVSPDATLEVSGGVLKVTIANGDGDQFRDPWFHVFFDYDPAYYRVVEIRLKNPAALPGSGLALFWGSPWGGDPAAGQTINQHSARIPSAMEEFQTILIPMNVDEVRIIPGPTEVGHDGLWASGELNNTLRIDPLDTIPVNDATYDGTVFEIDSIRIREDYRFDFHGDIQGILARVDIDDFVAEGGFLSYVVADVGRNLNPDPVSDGIFDPVFLTELYTGRLEAKHFTRLAFGVETEVVAADSIRLGVYFDDQDSQGYWDDCPAAQDPPCTPGTTTLQELNVTFQSGSRQDVAFTLDDIQIAAGTTGEWSEDGRIPTSSLRVDCPQNAAAQDTIRLDYLAWIPAEPFGPSEAVVVEEGTEVRLSLDGPILAGANTTVTGSGAPKGDGIWVELWRVPEGGSVPESLASAQAVDGAFAFDGVSLDEGDRLHVTLSRSWQFEVDDAAEGWDADVSPDATLDVSGGVLRMTIGDGNADTLRDPWARNAVTYDPRYYRVVEVRLKNPVPLAQSVFGIFWGAPWGERINLHDATIPSAMDGFATILIPMNVDEVRIAPDGPVGGLDGLWDTGALNTSLRIDPLNNLPAADPSYDGLVFEIDSIRIRQDYVFDFAAEDDAAGVARLNDVDDIVVEGGYLTYGASDTNQDGLVDPFLLTGLYTGRLDTGYFRRFVLGMDNLSVATNPLVFGIYFDDQDSQGYWDNCLPPACTPPTDKLQEANFALPATGRQDVSVLMNVISGGEWSEDGGRIPTSSLRVDCPQGAVEGDTIRIDYLGWTSVRQVPPSEEVLVEGGGQPRFRRGDSNDDGKVDLSDAVYTLNWLFTGGPEPTCKDAADVDDNGTVEITDPINALNWLFTGGDEPPPPGPTQCGPDVGADELPACEYASGC